MQGAKMAFVELREVGSWAIQGVVAASAEGKPVSRQMVKWIGGIKLESYVVVEATVQKPLEPVKSCRVSEFELHLTKVYVVATAPETWEWDSRLPIELWAAWQSRRKWLILMLKVRWLSRTLNNC
jgi:aspartyl/asparaginyl-tRNA synthetase